ncbi:hypothetical protein LSAT2_005049 [Lamellibrachia satsuma]|nr:hypothetical protein LSAT2_005049 [Lamellibrachia satsuma]
MSKSHFSKIVDEHFIISSEVDQHDAHEPVLLLVVAGAHGQFTINVDLTRSKGHIGDGFTASCRVINEQKIPYFIVWERKAAGHTVEIASNENINYEFHKTGRYSANLTMDRDNDIGEVTFYLRISGELRTLPHRVTEISQFTCGSITIHLSLGYRYTLLVSLVPRQSIFSCRSTDHALTRRSSSPSAASLEAADSGEIGCRIPSQKIEVFKELVVFVPVQSVKLTSQYTNGTHAVAYIDGQVVAFNEGESRRVFCHVSGSYPAPEMAIMVGDKDMTSDFNEDVRLVKKGSFEELQDLTYEVTLSNDLLVLDYAYNKKLLKCVATLPGSGFPAKSLGIDVQIAGYKPKFDCVDTMLSEIHENGVNITCVVHADPPVSKANFYWRRFSSGDPVTLDRGQEDGHYTAYIVPGNSSGEIRMVLRIDRVFTQHFRKYYFHAENDIGNSTFAVSLKQDGYQMLKSGSSATWMAYGTLLTLITAARLL